MKIVINGKEAHLPSDGGTEFTTDETLSMSEDKVLSVTVPVRGMTKEEFQAAEDKKGLIVVTDEKAPASGGGSSDEVYSTEEVRIGTWIDGKPLYRKVINLTIPRTASSYEKLADGIPDASPKRVSPYIYASEDSCLALPYKVYEYYLNVLYEDGIFYYYADNYLWVGMPIIVIVEYTKTTD